MTTKSSSCGPSHTETFARITVAFEPPLLDGLRRLAQREDRSVAGMVRLLVRNAIDRQPRAEVMA
jgi:hypothetical protein